jgi:hypothetical protein
MLSYKEKNIITGDTNLVLLFLCHSIMGETSNDFRFCIEKNIIMEDTNLVLLFLCHSIMGETSNDFRFCIGA